MAHILLVNTVHFFQWVIVENTLVMVAASVPLIRPLTSGVASRKAITHYGSNAAYELNSRQKGSQAFAYGGNSATKSVVQASSSEENILPIQNGSLGGGKERERQLAADVEQGVIKKQVHYEVTYDSETPGSAPQTSQWNIRSKGSAR